MNYTKGEDEMNYYEMRLMDYLIEELLKNDATPPMIFEGYQLPHVLLVKHKWNKEVKIWTQFEIRIRDNHFEEIKRLDFEILKDKYYREITIRTANDKEESKQQIIDEPVVKKFCDECGTSIPLEERFCPSCGNILEEI